MKKFWCSVIIFSTLFFQENSANSGLDYPKKVIGGKTYYEYPVQKSEGFYSICKKFGVTEEEIKAVNPGTQNGLAYDTIVLIPYKEEKYTLHRVSRKETLYSIAKRYEVSVSDIYAINPTLEKEGLKSGTDIKIPEKTKKVASQNMTVNDTLVKVQKKENQPTFTVHQVVKGETLYSISRLYGISTDEIIRLNPDVKEGVKIGKKLIIPPVHTATAIQANSVEGKNVQFVTHVVKKQETLYSLSKQYGVTHEEIVRLNPSVNDGLKEGMILIIPPSFNKTEEVQNVVSADTVAQPTVLDSITDVKSLFVRSMTPKKEISIAIALPFQLSKVSDKTKIDGNTKKFLEFYQGFLLAIDSLRNQGLSFTIRTYDSGKTEAEIQKLLEKEELKSCDVIFGPAYNSQMKLMADFALANNIKLVIPFSSKVTETAVNPNVFQINAPADKMNYMMADLFIRQFKDQNIVLWRFKNPTYDDKKQFADTLEVLLKQRQIAYKMVYFDNLATIRAAMSNDKENIVIPMTANQVALSQVLPMVNMLQTDKRKISLFGFSEWQSYQSVSKDLYVLNTYFATPFHTDFNNPEVRNFLAKFRHFYNSEPFNAQPQYGMLGYDLAMYFSTAISVNGHDFEFAVTPVETGTIQTKFNFSRVSEKGGFYSTGIYLTNHNDQSGLTAIDGMTMQMCPVCSENLKKMESQKK